MNDLNKIVNATRIFLIVVILISFVSLIHYGNKYRKSVNELDDILDGLKTIEKVQVSKLETILKEHENEIR